MLPLASRRCGFRLPWRRSCILNLLMIEKSFRCLPRNTAKNTIPSWTRAPVLPDVASQTFHAAVERSSPALLPRGTFHRIPAIHRWFSEADGGGMSLEQAYWEPYGTALVSLELTTPNGFHRASAPLSILTAFLESADESTKARFYLAQAPLHSLPKALANDLPMPLILGAENMDICDTSLWLGKSPTSTPLHRDPNPNLLVQLAGEKQIRMLPPEAGDALFAKVHEILGDVAGHARARGDEMMLGTQKDLLEDEIWQAEQATHGLEATLGCGDGLFIPQGWWHSIRGTGHGVTASVNWWFRSKRLAA